MVYGTKSTPLFFLFFPFGRKIIGRTPQKEMIRWIHWDERLESRENPRGGGGGASAAELPHARGRRRGWRAANMLTCVFKSLQNIHVEGPPPTSNLILHSVKTACSSEHSTLCWCSLLSPCPLLCILCVKELCFLEIGKTHVMSDFHLLQLSLQQGSLSIMPKSCPKPPPQTAETVFCFAGRGRKATEEAVKARICCRRWKGER